MELGTDYQFRDDLFDKKEEGATVPIELLIDPFKGVVYRYTKVSFKLDGDTPRMLYDYDIINSPDLSMMTLRKNEKFNTTLGLILNMMLLEVSDADENGSNNSEEPDSEGGIHQERPSVPTT
jgi:hypothetical protein